MNSINISFSSSRVMLGCSILIRILENAFPLEHHAMSLAVENESDLYLYM